MVEAIAPEPGQTIADPACGTGGFFLAAKDYITEHYPNLTRDVHEALREETFQGWEIVDNTVRLCTMNLYLHEIGSDAITDAQQPPVVVGDALLELPDQRYDVVLTNPPFGKKSSFTIVNKEGQAETKKLTYERDDFWTTTSNKQLNFVQHVANMLAIGGETAIVVQDDVLFEDGSGETVRERLLRQYDVHTLLRLPTGIFYAQGVKANLRAQARQRDAVDAETVDLRPAHEQALHPQKQPAYPQRPGGLHRVLQSGRAAQPGEERAFPVVRLR